MKEVHFMNSFANFDPNQVFSGLPYPITGETTSPATSWSYITAPNSNVTIQVSNTIKVDESLRKYLTDYSMVLDTYVKFYGINNRINFILTGYTDFLNFKVENLEPIVFIFGHMHVNIKVIAYNENGYPNIVSGRWV